MGLHVSARVLVAGLLGALMAGPTMAAPVLEESIQIQFPDPLGAFALQGRTVFPQKGAGASIVYQGKDMRGAVYVYDNGKPPIPNGVGSPTVHVHFMETVAALDKASRESSVKVKPGHRSISAFPGCGPQFLWRADGLETGGRALVSRTYLTGLNGQFVKLRVTHPAADAAQAEQFVQDIRRVLGKCG